MLRRVPRRAELGEASSLCSLQVLHATPLPADTGAQPAVLPGTVLSGMVPPGMVLPEEESGSPVPPRAACHIRHNSNNSK